MCSVLHCIFSTSFLSRFADYLFYSEVIDITAEQRAFPQVRSSPGRSCVCITPVKPARIILGGMKVVGWSHVNHTQIPAVLVAVPSRDLGWASVWLQIFGDVRNLTSVLRTITGSQCSFYCRSLQLIVLILVALFPSWNHLLRKDNKYPVSSIKNWEVFEWKTLSKLTAFLRHSFSICLLNKKQCFT